jgi:hypothetical protein
MPQNDLIPDAIRKVATSVFHYTSRACGLRPVPPTSPSAKKALTRMNRGRDVGGYSSGDRPSYDATY